MYRTIEKPTYKAKTWSNWFPDELNPKEVYLTHLGQTRCHDHFKMHQVIRQLTFYLFTEGKGVFEINHQSHLIEGGELMIVRPGSHIHYHHEPSHPWHYQWFVLGGAEVSSILESARINEMETRLKGEWFKNLSEVFFRIQKHYRNDDVSILRAKAFALEILAIIQEQQGGRSAQTLSSLCLRAKNLIEEEFHTGLQIEDVAKRLKVSRSTLFRHFSQEYGESPKVFLDEFRLLRADELLQRGLINVQETAYACGFQNPHYFSRAYKKFFGASPAFRKATSS